MLTLITLIRGRRRKTRGTQTHTRTNTDSLHSPSCFHPLNDAQNTDRKRYEGNAFPNKISISIELQKLYHIYCKWSKSNWQLLFLTVFSVYEIYELFTLSFFHWLLGTLESELLCRSRALLENEESFRFYQTTRLSFYSVKIEELLENIRFW